MQLKVPVTSPRVVGPGAESLEQDLLRLIEESREQAAEDPFRNPVLAVTLAITRRFDRGEIGEDDLDALFPRLRAQSLATRAERLRAYVGLDRDAQAAPDTRMAARLVAALPGARAISRPFAISWAARVSRWCSPPTRPSACRAPSPP